MTDEKTSAGHCVCGEIQYQMTSLPLVVHCCHCSWCQRETGAAFALNALIESDKILLLKGIPASITVPSNSGNGQVLKKCPTCQTTLWSHYSGLGEHMAFVRVGTLESPGSWPPDVHIFARTKQPWLVLDDAPVMPEYYRRSEIWRPDALKRYDALKQGGS